MLPAFLLFAFTTYCQVNAGTKPDVWPLFEFWNPLTWINPKFSTEIISNFLKPGRESTRKVYQQLKKALLPANLFFGNIRAQYAAWDSEKHKKPKNSKGSRRPDNKKFSKNSSGKNQRSDKNR